LCEALSQVYAFNLEGILKMVLHESKAPSAALDSFGKSVIADPITKIPKKVIECRMEYGVVELMVSLKNSPGY
jgi:hypothetical protein